MPDKRRHRGQHPEDARLFAEDQLQALRISVAEYSWLLTRGYAQESAVKLVGDRHALTARQRVALMRSACSDQALKRRSEKLTTLTQSRGGAIGIDGYNLLITIESALSDGVVLVGRDGCYRDLASIHGTYRKVEETIPAVRLIADYLSGFGIAQVDWYLDRPVSNSGRLKALMAKTLTERESKEDTGTIWSIELANSPDAVLADYAGPVVTSDSVVLDRCATWINLGAEIIEARIPDARTIHLGADRA